MHSDSSCLCRFEVGERIYGLLVDAGVIHGSYTSMLVTLRKEERPKFFTSEIILSLVTAEYAMRDPEFTAQYFLERSTVLHTAFAVYHVHLL